MTQEEIQEAIEAINESILHWYHDIYYPLLMGRLIGDSNDVITWHDTGDPVQMGSWCCPLCILYHEECDLCPLRFCGDGSVWMKFANIPTTENAMNMILALVKARDYLEEQEQK
jgi:hypothetical protein